LVVYGRFGYCGLRLSVWTKGADTCSYGGEGFGMMGVLLNSSVLSSGKGSDWLVCPLNFCTARSCVYILRGCVVHLK
jgi:hypothetical protein